GFITVAQGAAGLRFLPNANFFGNGSFQVQAALGPTNAQLGGGLATATIVVNPIADTPSVTNAQTDEDTLSMGGLVISRNPVDGAEVTHYQITSITNGTLFLNDGVTVVTNGSFITATQGAAGLRFLPSTNFFGVGTFQIQAAVGNTIADLGGSVITAQIVVNPINDPPVITAPASATTPEDTVLAFSTGNGLLISVADVDIFGGELRLSLSVSQGTLTLGSTAGLTFVSGTTNGTANFIIQGTLADINAALATLSYLPNLNYFGGDALVIEADDLGNSGGPGAAPLPRTVNLNITPVNDAPVWVVPGLQQINESTALVLSSANGNAPQFSDVDAFNLPQTVSLSVPVGTLTLATTSGITFLLGANGTGNMTIQGTLADLNAALDGLTFLHFDNATLVLSAIVTDDMAASVPAAIPLTVLNVAPTLTFINPAIDGLEGTTISFGSTATDPANPPSAPAIFDPLLFSWTVTRNGQFFSQGTGETIFFTPNNEGTYVVTLTVDDQDGGISVITQSISVANVPATPITLDTTDIDSQLTATVDTTVSDPGDDTITVTVLWNDFVLNSVTTAVDPFLANETAIPRDFPTLVYKYQAILFRPNPLDQVTIEIRYFDGTDTVVEFRQLEVTDQNVPAVGIYVTPEPEEIPPVITPTVAVQPLSLVTPPQLAQQAEDRVFGQQELSEAERILVLRIVLPDGSESPNIPLQDRVLQDLPGLFKKLPDGRYRIYLIQENNQRLVVDVVIRQGQAFDPTEPNSDSQDRPPPRVVLPPAQDDSTLPPSPNLQTSPPSAQNTPASDAPLSPPGQANPPAPIEQTLPPADPSPPPPAGSPDESTNPPSQETMSTMAITAGLGVSLVLTGASTRRGRRWQRAMNAVGQQSPGATGQPVAASRAVRNWRRNMTVPQE
ncbi:MAG: hypothetical protein SFX18_20085, partial [Pirellulales bacterium]|nr:hypothetical protein [Pirellulales bacterium]